MGMAYESTVESADNRNLFQKLQSYSQYPRSYLYTFFSIYSIQEQIAGHVNKTVFYEIFEKYQRID